MNRKNRQMVRDVSENSPLLDLSKNRLTKMLSIKVAEWQVILVGRVINGKNIFEYNAYEI